MDIENVVAILERAIALKHNVSYKKINNNTLVLTGKIVFLEKLAKAVNWNFSIARKLGKTGLCNGILSKE